MAKPAQSDAGTPKRRPRQARTRLARRAVVEAAEELFASRGFVGTTMEAISETSDVPPATVYRLFGSKLGVLKELLDVSIGGDDQPVTVQERPEVARLFDEPRPEQMLAAFADLVTSINERISGVYTVLLGAAAADPDAADLFDDLQQQRRRGQSAIAAALVESGGLRHGLRQDDAADLIHALMSPELYRLLVVDRGWSTSRYRSWLTSTVCHQLLAAPPDET